MMILYKQPSVINQFIRINCIAVSWIFQAGICKNVIDIVKIDYVKEVRKSMVNVLPGAVNENGLSEWIKPRAAMWWICFHHLTDISHFKL